MPRIFDVVDESVLRVSKLWSCLRIAPRRSSEIAATSVTMRGSRSALCADTIRPSPHTIAYTNTVTSSLRVIVIVLNLETLERERVASVGAGATRVKARTCQALRPGRPRGDKP
jgi:hypothetical protein